MSKFNFRIRRSERKAFKHIAHGLIPAATIAPRPAVPRTPPPRSPDPSPERSRSALAAAILSSSLTGRTFAIPPPHNRSFSESDCSNIGGHTGFEPDASTALYTREQWPVPMADKTRLPSPPPHDEEEEEEEETEEDEDRDEERDESHVYQSLRRQSRASDFEAVYAAPLKKASNHSKVEDDTENSTFEIVSPLNTEDETEVEDGTALKKPPVPLQTRSPFNRSLASLDLNKDLSDLLPKYPTSSTPKRKTSVKAKSPIRDSKKDTLEAYHCAGEPYLGLKKELNDLREQNHTLILEKEVTERRCSEMSRQILLFQQQLTQSPQERRHNTGESSELLSLRQQAQELIDENDGLKMTVHRLNVELNKYQARFRPLTKDEQCQSSGLPKKGAAPPWLLDMKYLSPLVLAYEDHLTERDQLIKNCEEEVKMLRTRAEEVIQENEKLHTELSKKNIVTNKEWRQMQDQAWLVLEENQVLIEQLEMQHAKAKEIHSKHTQEVCKVSKQVMLLEAEKQGLEVQLEAVRKELGLLQMEFEKARSALENSVSCREHGAATDNLKRQLEEMERIKSRELEALQPQVGVLQAENKTLVLEKNDLNAHVKHLESELQLARQENRKAQKHINFLKQQLEESLRKELTDHQYLTSIVMLAEKTTHERDQLIQMASSLDKKGALTRMVDETVRLRRLQNRVKVFKHQASASVCALSQRLCEQEQDFAGKVASFQREIQHLQAQLRDRQEQLSGALQQKREVENELEVVWEATTKENQHLQNMVMGRVDFLLGSQESCLSLAWKPQENCHQAHTRGQEMNNRHSDSHQHNSSSDEDEKNGLDLIS